MKGFISRMAIFMAAFMSIATFVACSNDDDNASSNPLVGTWYTGDKDAGDYTEITFRAGLTCSLKEYDLKGEVFEDNGRYEVDEDLLMVWWDSEKEYWERHGPWKATFAINGKVMTTSEAGGTVWYKK